MADQKVSALTEVTSRELTDIVYIVTDSTSKKITVENLLGTVVALLSGRSGGQTLSGSDTTAEDLTLEDNTVDKNQITVTEMRAKADDTAVVHNSGNETVAGIKTFAGIKTILEGFVGIGIPAPLLKLDVAGSGRLTATASSSLTGTADPAASTTLPGTDTLFLTELVIGDRITVNAETRTVTAIASNVSLTVDTAFTDTTGGATVTKLPAEFIVRDSSNNVVFIVQDNGYVGIGTTKPGVALDVVGSIKSTDHVYIYTGKVLYTDNVWSTDASKTFTLAGKYAGNTGDSVVIRPAATSTTDSGQFNVLSIKPTYNQTGTAAATDLLINRTETAVGSGTQLLQDWQVGGVSKMVVTNTGNVGIGIAAPNATLTVNGSQSVKRTDAGAANYNPSILTTDYLITANNTAAARAITISTEDVASGTVANPRIFIISDEYGSASTNPLTITLESGGTINGAASAVIANSRGIIELHVNGTNAFFNPTASSIFGEMYFYNSTGTETVSVANSYYAVQGQYGAGELGGFTFVAGSSGSGNITTAAAGAAININDTAHGLVSGDYVNVQSANHNGTSVVTYVDDNNFTVAIAYVGDEAGTWQEGDYLLAQTPGRYKIDFSVTASADSAAKEYKFEPVQNATHIDKASFTITTSGTDHQSGASSAIITVAVGDRIWTQFKNETDTQDLNYEHSNLNLFRL